MKLFNLVIYLGARGVKFKFLKWWALSQKISFEINSLRVENKKDILIIKIWYS